MKKITSLLLGFVLIGATSFAQPVSDRAVIPVAVTLNQILRLNVFNGGNVEFVFNNIVDYKNGLTNLAGQYQTDISVASSTPWSLLMWAEDASFTGNDDPTNLMPLGYVGYSILANGGFSFDNEYLAYGNVSIVANTLTNAASSVFGCSAISTASNCAGDATDNIFQIQWMAGNGVAVAGNMLTTAFINAGIEPDRYTNNVFLDLVTSGL